MASGTITEARKAGQGPVEGQRNGGDSKAGRMCDLTWDPGDPASNATYFRLLARGTCLPEIFEWLSRQPLTCSYFRWLGAAE